MKRRYIKELCTVVDEWVAIYKEDKQNLPKPTNRRYSGKFILRTGSELHKALTVRAISEGDSLNKYVVKKLKSIL